MKRYQTPFDLQCNTPTAVALGTFDGLHLAHRRVIEQAVASPYPSVVFAIEKQGSASQGSGVNFRLPAERGAENFGD